MKHDIRILKENFERFLNEGDEEKKKEELKSLIDQINSKSNRRVDNKKVVSLLEAHIGEKINYDSNGHVKLTPKLKKLISELQVVLDKVTELRKNPKATENTLTILAGSGVGSFVLAVYNLIFELPSSVTDYKAWAFWSDVPSPWSQIGDIFMWIQFTLFTAILYYALKFLTDTSKALGNVNAMIAKIFLLFKSKTSKTPITETEGVNEFDDIIGFMVNDIGDLQKYVAI